MTAGAFALGALAGAAGNLLSDGAKRILPVLWRGTRDGIEEAKHTALPQARDQFERNAVAFVNALADEVARGGGEAAAAETAAHIAEQLQDPDVAVAVADALKAAGRVSSADRHRALAKLVTARLAAEPESTAATAANLAVRAMEALGAAHLHALALLALVQYAGRPNSASPAYAGFPEQPAPPEYRDGVDHNQVSSAYNEAFSAWHTALAPLAAAYAEQLLDRVRRVAGRLNIPDEIPESVTVHLAASGCVIRHDSAPALYEGMARPIAPPPPPDSSVADRARDDTVSRAYSSELFFARSEPALQNLAALWRSTLSRLTLTPAGLLLGLAALDVLADEQTSLEWRWSGVTDHAVGLSPHQPSPSWDPEWANDPQFHRMISNAIEQAKGRGFLR